MILYKRILFIRITLHNFMMPCEMIHTNCFNLHHKRKLREGNTMKLFFLLLNNISTLQCTLTKFFKVTLNKQNKLYLYYEI